MSDNVVDAEILGYFIDDALEGLESWVELCLEAQKDQQPSQLDGLFRIAHNLKGSSKSLGLKEFGNLVHKVEDLIKALQEGQAKFGDESLRVLLAAETLLRSWVARLRDNPDYIPKEMPQLMSDVDRSMNVETAPSNPTLGEILVASGAVSELQIQEALTQQNRRLGEILVDQGVAAPEVVQAALEKQKSQRSGSGQHESIRVDRNKLDNLMDLVGELTISQNILDLELRKSGNGNSQLRNLMDQIHTTMSRVQEATIDLRLVTLEQMFRRLERVAWELSQEIHKPIEIVKEGEHVALDKTVVDRIAEPLIHMIRNSLDHGLENPDDRTAAGKASVGRILIEARDFSGGVEIRISDDGKGIDPNRIFTKARDKGLIKGEMTDYDQRKILNLIFLPGFSTAEKLTDISGRGVGMDIVKSTVTALGGHVEVSSQVGQGTSFSIQLPTNLSLVDAFIFSSNQQNFAVPTQDVTEIIDLGAFQINQTSSQQNFIELRGEPVLIEKINRFLDLPQRSKQGPTAVSDQPQKKSRKPRRPALIVSGKTSLWAFELEGIQEKQTIFVKPLAEKIQRNFGLSGSTILADGKPCMIVNFHDVIQKLEVAA